MIDGIKKYFCSFSFQFLISSKFFSGRIFHLLAEASIFLSTPKATAANANDGDERHLSLGLALLVIADPVVPIFASSFGFVLRFADGVETSLERVVTLLLVRVAHVIAEIVSVATFREGFVEVDQAGVRVIKDHVQGAATVAGMKKGVFKRILMVFYSGSIKEQRNENIKLIKSSDPFLMLDLLGGLQFPRVPFMLERPSKLSLGDLVQLRNDLLGEVKDVQLPLDEAVPMFLKPDPAVSAVFEIDLGNDEFAAIPQMESVTPDVGQDLVVEGVRNLVEDGQIFAQDPELVDRGVAHGLVV